MNVDVALTHAKAIYQQVIDAVDPTKLVRQYLRLASDALVADDVRLGLTKRSRLVVIALGKAAPKLMAGAIAAVGPRIDSALTITKPGVPIPDVVRESGYPIVYGGHPVPDEGSLQAGAAALDLVSSLQADDILLMLISGGGSAVMELPIDGLTLEDLQATTSLMLESGADINQQNAVRHRLSRLKGGKLANAAFPTRVINLIVSDVLANPLPVIASGPTVAFDPALDRGIEALVDTPLWTRLPEAVRDALTDPGSDTPAAQRGSIQSIIIADSHTAAEAAVRAAEAEGFCSELTEVAFTGEAREFAAGWVERARSALDCGESERPICLIGAGELTVTVTGGGVGGRNSELLLAAAMLIDGDDRLGVVSLATDGDDGTTGAAGGVVTGRSCRIARSAGLEPEKLLKGNDSQRFLDATGGSLRSGLTGTNVNDIYLAFIDSPVDEGASRRETCAPPDDAA